MLQLGHGAPAPQLQPLMVTGSNIHPSDHGLLTWFSQTQPVPWQRLQFGLTVSMSSIRRRTGISKPFCERPWVQRQAIRIGAGEGRTIAAVEVVGERIDRWLEPAELMRGYLTAALSA